MNAKHLAWLSGAAVAGLSSVAAAGTPAFFQPLTESAPVTTPNSVEEMTAPWTAPAGVSQENLTSLSEVEGDIAQSIVRVPGTGTSASMFDMVAFDDSGRYIFIPHETPFGAGVSRYDMETDESTVLFSGDLGGATGDWSKDYAAFDPSLYTPNGTLFLAEEWAGEGRVMEVLNPLAPASKIKVRELESIANVAHEGLRFSHDARTLYYVDEWNSGSIYKFVTSKKGNYEKGQTFVLSVDDFDGVAADNYNEGVNATAARTGMATWIPLTDKHGNKLTVADPFLNGPTTDPRTDPTCRGGRPAADEVGATPYGRPEDMEIGKLKNGHEVMYFTATSENAIYSVEMLDGDKAIVRLAASETDTPKNLGFAATTAAVNSPDNLAQDALGNIYVIEDAPNGSSVGGDIWMMRDEDSDGVAESMDHFLSIRVDGSEATGMIWNPVKATEFVVAVQHPDSVDLTAVPEGMGDALWIFDVSGTESPDCAGKKFCKNKVVKALEHAEVKAKIEAHKAALKAKLKAKLKKVISHLKRR